MSEKMSATTTQAREREEERCNKEAYYPELEPTVVSLWVQSIIL